MFKITVRKPETGGFRELKVSSVNMLTRKVDSIDIWPLNTSTNIHPGILSNTGSQLVLWI